MSTLRTLALLAGALLATSCASAVPATPPTGGTPVGVTWALEDLGGQKPVDGSPVTLTFADDGAVTGSGGCNRLAGTYEIDGARLTFGEAMSSTAMACSDDVMAVETALLDALVQTRGFAVDDETLTLTSDDGSTLATFAAQAQGLAGTSWVLTGYNNGAQAVVSPILGVEVTLAFGDDGSLSGFGGCNRLFGDYTSADGEISFGLVGSTNMACASPEGVMEQEAAFIAALSTAATYTIEGDKLAMRTADDAMDVNFVRG